MKEKEPQDSTDDAGLASMGEFKPVSRVALSGLDLRGINPEAVCQTGDKVAAGATVIRDARRPQIALTTAVSGEVVKIEYGARRKLASLQIEPDENPDAIRIPAPDWGDGAAMRKFMLDAGAWCGLRTRPFGNIPDPEGEPAAILVTAIDNDPQSPPAGAIINLFDAEFRSAVNALATISTAPVYVCHSTQHTPPVDVSAQLQCKPFPGDYRMGLPGAHVNALCPIGFAGKQVWQIAYPEVISLGHLLLRGTAWAQRIITLSGDAVKRPRLLRVPTGASIKELLLDELPDELQDDSPVTVLSGSAKYGREISSAAAFLGAGQRQVTVLSAKAEESSHSRCEVVIPSETLEACAPPGIYAVALMRALQICDVDRARDLGALELLEEDLAALGRACHSQGDFGFLLRQVLDQLEPDY
jgi:Na+-transporting NADH:ubiquinone oxidoreductase subunit A